jgi:GcrA cell cycle regulator
MSWTEERVELLRKLWNEGLSASRVAAELGDGITRNAVIGKIHRLGLAERAKSPAAQRPRSAKQQRQQSPQDRQQGPVVLGNVALALAAEPVTAPVQRRDDDVVIPISERVTLMDLRESMCRWPMGDPSNSEFRFCGARSPAGSGPYCAHHARVAYQPAHDRRRMRDAMRTVRIA